MMAKMFYTMDEARAALSKTEEEIKQYAREGRLREFRDGARLMFKADQVEQLKTELGGDRVDLGPSDSGAPIGLVDSKGASGTSITLSDTDAAGAPSPMQKEDTALAADLGLSGSVGGMPSPARTGTGLSGTAAGGRSGVNVFSADEVDQAADPSAQTAISSSVSEQVNLEGVGSGSGLLDLTRESDDTSLGAELLDEIAPGGGRRAPGASGSGTGMATGVGTGVAMEAVEGRGARIMGPVVYQEAADATAPAFGLASLAAAAALVFAAFVLTSALVGARPAIIQNLGNRGIWFTFGIGVFAAIILFFIGFFVGKSGRR